MRCRGVAGWVAVWGVAVATLTPLPAFQPAAAKTRGTNANPKKDNFVFGDGPSGAGYYRIDRACWGGRRG